MMNAEPPGDKAVAGDLDPAQGDANPDRHGEQMDDNQPVNEPQGDDDDGSNDEQLYDDPSYGFENHPHHVPPPAVPLRRSTRIQKQTEKLQRYRGYKAHRETDGAAHPPPKTTKDLRQTRTDLSRKHCYQKKETYGK